MELNLQSDEIDIYSSMMEDYTTNDGTVFSCKGKQFILTNDSQIKKFDNDVTDVSFDLESSVKEDYRTDDGIVFSCEGKQFILTNDSQIKKFDKVIQTETTWPDTGINVVLSGVEVVKTFYNGIIGAGASLWK